MSALSQSHEASFQEVFMSALDRAMLLLGDSGREATYYHIEKTFRLKRNMWHKNPEAFTEALKQIFGAQGSRLLLNAIAKELMAQLNLKIQEKTVSLPELIRLAEQYTRGVGGI
jgi:alanine-alpha-ketoisovalerate/valine-pyruvate aminotransferase